jgi:hypothetical protein
MPDLAQSLQGRDLGHLKVIAELWGIEMAAPDARIALQRLAPQMLDKETAAELIDSLPGEALEAIQDLLRNEGRLPWALFTRRYGKVREMGAARRDRERPYLQPVSPAEILWYRALVACSFFDTSAGAAEFAYIPQDLLLLLPPPQTNLASPPGRAASLSERAHPILASDVILDYACTLLAALRLGLPHEAIHQYTNKHWSNAQRASYHLAVEPLQVLLTAASFLDEQGLPRPEPVKAFLEAERGEALAKLVRAWLPSRQFNELRLIPHLHCEGEWQNDPVPARQMVLDFISALPTGSWWSLGSFVADIRLSQPDFQRPAGDYDSWYIRDNRKHPDDPQRGEYLRGFDHWDDVDGELIRYIITGPMHWLGLADLAHPSGEGRTTAFRLSKWAGKLLVGEALDALPKENEALIASSGARIFAPRLAPRSARYQVSRFCTWEGENEDGYQFRITPASLAQARQQGLSVQQLTTLMRRYAQGVPSSFGKALERWEQHGVEARMEQVTVLRLSTPDLMQTVRNSKAGRFLGNPLGPTAVIVKAGAGKKVLDLLAEMGYLGEASFEL